MGCARAAVVLRQRVTLLGGRRCLYGEGAVPHLMYRVGGQNGAAGQNMSLYVLDGVARATADLRTLGHRSRIWTRGATTYVLVTPAEIEMTQAVNYVMQEVR